MNSSGFSGDKGRSLPSKEEIVAFIEQSPAKVGRREIAEAFNLRGSEKVHVKLILKELKNEAGLQKYEKRRNLRGDDLPAVLVVEAKGLSPEGEMLALPIDWPPENKDTPSLFMDSGKGIVLDIGERALVKLKKIGRKTYKASPIKRIGRAPRKLLGVYEKTDQSGMVRPVDRKAKGKYHLRPEHSLGASHGELVLVELLSHRHRRGDYEVKVIERLGEIDNPGALSLVAIHEHQIPSEFPDESLQEAETATTIAPSNRVDLRDVPLITIDGENARDFDDAVWAEKDSDRNNPGGWHAIVAIADVSAYVEQNSALDIEARKRGNSTYFADQVVPMLPETLSNGWCSLVPQEDRLCMAVHLWISADGELIRHQFIRGLMRSAARLTYGEVQESLNGLHNEKTAPLSDGVLKPLLQSFKALEAARKRRGTLDLEIPEYQPKLDGAGNVVAIERHQRFDSHKIVEELMIAANVAAATELEGSFTPSIYRVHEPPDRTRLEDLAEFLRSMGLSLAKGQVITPQALSRLLQRASKLPQYSLISELVLRCQSQARYTTDNSGHFGLALQRYTHFTSPIRRYADLMVHRALIKKLKLGEGAMEAELEQNSEEIAILVSKTERRSALAERDTNNRLTAHYMRRYVGEVFQGKVNGVTRAGLFVTLEDTGADGLLPMRHLPEDFYHLNEEIHQLVGKRRNYAFGLGDSIAVRLTEADAISGGIIFSFAESDNSSARNDRPFVRSLKKKVHRRDAKKRDHTPRRGREFRHR